MTRREFLRAATLLGASAAVGLPNVEVLAQEATGVSCARGARGILYPRWRPLLDGPLFGAFGPFAMDGSITPRAEMAGKVSKWANAHSDVWKSRPVKGDVGLVFIPESELFSYVQQGGTEYYAQSVRGAYQAFFDSNILVDFVALENIEEYRLVYLAYPVMLKQESAERLKNFVQQGGVLISEGLPGYFGDRGHVGTVQPNLGLDALFGTHEKYVEFDPDLSEQMTFDVKGSKIYGRYFRQDHDLQGGKAAGEYSNGNIAAVENSFGQGRTLLMGSFPGAGYYLHHGTATKDLFASFVKMAGLAPQVTIDDHTMQARLHQGDGGTHVWVTNPTREPKQVTVTLSDGGGQFQAAEDVWGDVHITVARRQLSMNVPARDAVVAMLR